MRRIEPPPYVGEIWEYGKLPGELVVTGKYWELTQTNDASYPYWEKWKYLASEWGIDPKKLWSIVKTQRRVVQKRISFTGQGKFIFHINTPSVVQQKLHELDLSLGGNLDAGAVVPSEEKQRYLISALMEEAIASSQLEGAATTRRIAKEMLESNRKPKNLSEQMIVNNYAAMQWIVENKNTHLDIATIQHIHRIITKNTLSEKNEEGVFRTTDDIHIVDVQTGTILHTPPGQQGLEDLMSELCAFANDEKDEDFFLHPISKAIIIHFLVGFIHPFSDGNGRTARSLFYWYLIKKGYWLIEYMSVSRIILGSKAQYARAYQHTERDENDLTYFILYNLKAIEQSLAGLKKYIERKNKEKRNLLALLRNTEYNDRQIELLQEILDNRKSIFTVTEVETRFGISNQTARNDLNYLVKKGLLTPRKSGKKIQFVVVEGAASKLK